MASRPSEEYTDDAIGHRVLLGTVSNISGKVIAIGVWLVLTPLILHRLGPATFGLWTLAASTVAYGALLDLGITSALIKYVAEFRATAAQGQACALIATALRIYTCLGAIAALLGIALAPLFPIVFRVPVEERGRSMALVMLLACSLGVSIPCTTGQAVLQGLQRYDLVNVLYLASTIAGGGAAAIALLLDGGVIALAAVNIPVAIATQLGATWMVGRVAPGFNIGWRGADWRLARLIAGFSVSSFVAQLAWQLQTKTDEIVIGASLPLTAITPYSLARRVAEAPQLLINQFVKVLLPLASGLHAGDEAGKLRTLYIFSTRLTLVLFLPVGGGLIAVAEPLLTLWVGHGYGANGGVVAILTMSGLISLSQWPAATILQGIARHAPLAVIAVASGTANLALSFVLVHPFGLVGVALGTLIPTLVECLVLVLPYSMRVLEVSPLIMLRQIVLPALAPAVPMAAILTALRLLIQPQTLVAIVAVIGAGLIVYATGYLLLGASPAERRLGKHYVGESLRIVRGWRTGWYEGC